MIDTSRWDATTRNVYQRMHIVASWTFSALNRIVEDERKQGIAPGTARRYASADGSSIQKSRRIYVRPRTGPQSAHL